MIFKLSIKKITALSVLYIFEKTSCVIIFETAQIDLTFLFGNYEQ